MQHNHMIDYFTRALPDKWNILTHEPRMELDGDVLFFNGLPFQMATFWHKGRNSDCIMWSLN
jgi:hypothetical protein